MTLWLHVWGHEIVSTTSARKHLIWLVRLWQAPTSPVAGARNEHGRYRSGAEEQSEVSSITFRETFLKSKAFEYLIAGEVPLSAKSICKLLVEGFGV